jgi:hypothetical protein
MVIGKGLQISKIIIFIPSFELVIKYMNRKSKNIYYKIKLFSEISTLCLDAITGYIKLELLTGLNRIKREISLIFYSNSIIHY